MPVKIARSPPRPSFGLRELLVASHISRLASRDAAKSLLSTLVSESHFCGFRCRTLSFLLRPLHAPAPGEAFTQREARPGTPAPTTRGSAAARRDSGRC